MSEREIIRVAITPQAKAAIDALSQRFGMSQIELASRIYNWFGTQDEVLQAAVLKLLPESMEPDILRLALQRLASDAAPATPQSRAAKPARQAVHVTTKLPGSRTPRRNKPE